MSETYRVFKRSARNFEEFARARKITVRQGLSRAEARQFCIEANRHRSPQQKSSGLKFEFEQE